MLNNSRRQSWFEWLIPRDLGNTSATRQGLQRLLLLRGFVTVMSVLGLLIFQSFSELDIPFSFIMVLIAAIFASIVLGYWRLQQRWAVSQMELFCHLLMDVVFLVLLVYYTGGVSNPLISYLLVLLAVTATLLPRSFVYSFALGSILLYTFFLLLDMQTDHEPSMTPMEDNVVFQLHLVGMWVIFLVSAILISVFITRMATVIRIRELNLAKARENEIRNEQLVAIGTLAAGTAHALGTPLSTMAVVLTELDKLNAEQLKTADIKDDITVLRQQVTRCKDSLTQLIRYYNKDNPVEEEHDRLSVFVSDIQDYITNIHPTATVQFSIEGEQDPTIPVDLSVKHAVINIIENGIKAADSRVDVQFRLSGDDNIEIVITDDGPGIPPQVMENLGEPFISMRKDSMGLGIFLANAAVQRLGGKIEMFNRKVGGAMTLIKLPLIANQEN
ncbi:MAG: ATP-binding protein [Pseudomonadales bacterium]|nr:ATP-binding protein [Pseudomonadales bacterium]